MKTDSYTKVVLTVIAICLTIIAFENVDIFPKVYAGDPNSINMKYGLVPLNADGSVDVTIKTIQGEMDVNIKNIETSDKLHVKVQEVDSYAYQWCVVPVQIRK